MTDRLHIAAGEFTPEIDFDAASGVLTISGESFHQRSVDFFAPVSDWLRTFFAETQTEPVFNFRLTYYNTISARRILEMLDMADKYSRQTGRRVSVNWYYDAGDVDIRESGKEFAAELDITFRLIENESTEDIK